MPSKRSKSHEREKKRRQREKLSEEQKEKEKEKAKDRMSKYRDEFPEIVDFEKTKHKHRIKKQREQRSGKTHLIDNLKAKKNMRLLKENGRVKYFANRERKNISEEEDWENMRNRGLLWRQTILI